MRCSLADAPYYQDNTFSHRALCKGNCLKSIGMKSYPTRFAVREIAPIRTWNMQWQGK